eukprot:50415_1
MSLIWYILLAIVSISTISSELESSGLDSSASSESSENCYDIVIVGGGFSGLYTAYRLGTSSMGNLKIALLEKKNYDNNWRNSGYSRNGITEISTFDNHACLGGLYEDYPFPCPGCSLSADFPDVAWVGGHAMRYDTSQGMFFLAQELGFHHEYGSSEGSMGHDRGYYFVDSQDLMDNKYIEDFNLGRINSLNAGELYDSAWDKNNIDFLCNNVDSFTTISSYWSNTTGSSNGLEAVIATNGGFMGDFAPNDPIGELEWLNQLFTSESGFVVYPENGMSMFIREMYRRIIDNEYADILCDFQVEQINENNIVDNDECSYVVQGTDMKNNLYANQVVLAIPSSDLQSIGGIITEIASSPFANVWNPVDSVTCQQQYDESWYMNLIPQQYLLQNTNKTNKTNNISVDKWSSTDNCIQRMENFNSEIIRTANVIRSVYADEGRCANEWKGIIEGSNYDFDGVVADEIRRRQADYFNVPIDQIPRALITECYITDRAWHFLAAGAATQIGNNPSVAVENWSFQPLESHDIFLCGNTWAASSAWTESTRSHCDLMMNTKLNVNENSLPQFDFSLSQRAQCHAICDSTGVDEQCDIPDRAILT